MAFRALDGPFDIGGTIPVATIHFVEERKRFLETPDHADQFPVLLPVRSHLRPNPTAIEDRRDAGRCYARWTPAHGAGAGAAKMTVDIRLRL